MSTIGTILVVDDEEGTRTAIGRALTPHHYAVEAVASAEEALVLLERQSFDVVLCDIRLDGMDGLELQHRVRVLFPDVPVVMITAYSAVDTAVRALRQGAYDYIAKPFAGEELRGAVRRAMESRRLRLENDSLRRVVRGNTGDAWIGESAVMQRLYAEAATVAQSGATVFISGETGTGKEILARYVHANSPRAETLFVALNCAAIPETLADSHLFGHVKGAFTGAVADARGYLEMADGGTLFLDEVADLRPDVQAKLLRAIEEGRLRRVGSDREVSIDVRILAAAQSEPERLVQEGRLREDLFFRIGAIHLRVPPLRERTGDIAGLALHFLARYAAELKKPIAGIEPEALKPLQAYAWPGNVRELRNVMERAAIFVRRSERVRVADLPEKIRSTPSAPAFTIAAATPPSLREVTEAYTSYVLERCEGNQAKAARLLGVAASTLWRHRQRETQE